MQRLEDGRLKKTLFIRDLGKKRPTPNEQLAEMFYLESIKYTMNGEGSCWQRVVLKDVTGTIDTRIWGDKINPEYEKYAGSVVMVQGHFTAYEGKPNITIDRMEPAADFEVTDYVESISDAVKEGADNVFSQVMEYIREPYKSLIDELFTPSVSMMERLPLNDGGAYAYLGGLLVYTAQCAQRVYHSLCVINPVKINISLALTAALLSEICKIDLLEQRGIFYRNPPDVYMLGSYACSIIRIMETSSIGKFDRRSRAELFHIFECLGGKIKPGTAEAKIVCEAVDTALFMGGFKADFDRYDKTYPCNMTEMIDAWALERRIFRRKGETDETE